MPVSTLKNTSVGNKVDSKLIKQFKEKDQITFILKFKDQVDTTRVAMEAAEKAKKQKLTEVSTKLQVRSAVVSTLRNTAMETQTEGNRLSRESKAKRRSEKRPIDQCCECYSGDSNESCDGQIGSNSGGSKNSAK
jgi:bacillopeptidase F